MPEAEWWPGWFDPRKINPGLFQHHAKDVVMPITKYGADESVLFPATSTLGIELELQVPRGKKSKLSGEHWVDNINRLSFWTSYFDRSIWSTESLLGVELISPIMQHGSIRKALTQAHEKFIKFGCEHDHTCAIHVHVGSKNPNPFLFEEVKRIIATYIRLEATFYAMAGRTEDTPGGIFKNITHMQRKYAAPWDFALFKDIMSATNLEELRLMILGASHEQAQIGNKYGHQNNNKYGNPRYHAFNAYSFFFRKTFEFRHWPMSFDIEQTLRRASICAHFIEGARFLSNEEVYNLNETMEDLEKVVTLGVQKSAYHNSAPVKALQQLSSTLVDSEIRNAPVSIHHIKPLIAKEKEKVLSVCKAYNNKAQEITAIFGDTLQSIVRAFNNTPNIDKAKLFELGKAVGDILNLTEGLHKKLAYTKRPHSIPSVIVKLQPRRSEFFKAANPFYGKQKAKVQFKNDFPIIGRYNGDIPDVPPQPEMRRVRGPKPRKKIEFHIDETTVPRLLEGKAVRKPDIVYKDFSFVLLEEFILYILNKASFDNSIGNFSIASLDLSSEDAQTLSLYLSRFTAYDIPGIRIDNNALNTAQQSAEILAELHSRLQRLIKMRINTLLQDWETYKEDLLDEAFCLPEQTTNISTMINMNKLLELALQACDNTKFMLLSA